MLIDSDFHDYYDTASQYGVDKTVVYRRKTEVEEVHRQQGYKFWERDVLPYSEKFGDFKVTKFVVGYCGKVYPAIRIESFQHKIDETFYTYDDCVEYLSRIKLGLNKERKKYRYASSFVSSGDFSIESKKCIEFFYAFDWAKYEKYFLEKKVPVFKLGVDISTGFRDYATTLVTSPSLKEIDFARVKDPFTAYQDIYQYISGVLGTPSMPMVEIADKYKQQQHGHDHKYSFRKEPSKK